MIPGYPFGYDLTLLDTKYCWSKKKEDGTWSEDKIVILYKEWKGRSNIFIVIKTILK